MSVEVSVVLCTRDPRPAELERTLAGLAAQTLARARWELVLVDNGSTPPVEGRFDLARLPARVVREPRAGKIHAILAGLAVARAEVIVTLDDDNVLGPAYLERALEALERHPFVGVAVGRVVAEYGAPPPAWVLRHAAHLAVHDLGEAPLYALLPGYEGIRCAGAGMVLRRAVLRRWQERLSGDARHLLFQRTAESLMGGSDLDIACTAFECGLARAYFPGLELRHLIPAARLEAGYFLRLVRANTTAGELVLLLHDASPRWAPKPLWKRAMRPLRELVLAAMALAAREMTWMDWRIDLARRRGTAAAQALFRERYARPLAALPVTP